MRRFIELLTVFLCVVVCAAAQQSIKYASVNGQIRDTQGEAVPGATVKMYSQATGSVLSASSNSGGKFRFGVLPPGRYTLHVAAAGFAPFQQALDLQLGSALSLPIRLSLASQKSSVTVNAAAPVIEAARTQVAGRVSHAEIRQLPVQGRDVMKLALLVPGITPANTGSTQTFAETSAVPGQGISVSGQRNFANNFIVDGLSANDDASGLSGTFFDQDVVNQFQVVTSGGQAEYGGAGGGYINVITKSGTDHTHGDLYGYFQNQRLNAANFLTGDKLPSTSAQYGASLGGSIGHSQTFYFGNFERRELNQDGLITIAPQSVGAINTTLQSDGYAGPLVSTGLYPAPIHDANAYGRLDHTFGENDRFNVRYSLYHVLSRNARDVGGLSAVSAGSGLDNDNQTLAISNVAILSPRMVNETRGEITYGNLLAPVNDPLGPAVAISGVATFGRLSVSPTARRNWLYELVDNLSLQAGEHSIKVGGDFVYNDLSITFPQASEGSYSFASLADFEAGRYNASGFSQSFGSPVIVQTNPNLGMYAQDQWTLSPSLTINAGVRYDLQFLQTIATDTNNVSPRVGVAWVPFASRRSIIRGSFGVYYDRIPLRPLANALQSSGNTTIADASTFVTASLSPGQASAPVFPERLPSLPPGVLVNFTTMDPNMQNGESRQASLQWEQELGPRTSVSATYQHVSGSQLLIDVNLNPPTCAAVGTNNGCRTQMAYGNNKQYSPLANSEYNGVSLSFTERPAEWGSLRATYTYARAYDDVGEFFFSGPMNNFDIREDWGRSDDDERSQLVLDGTLRMPGEPEGWSRVLRNTRLSASMRAYSAPPFNIVTGSNTVQGTAARPLLPDGGYLPRNAGSGFDFVSLDARLSRTFSVSEKTQVELMLDAFNLLNHRNNLIPNATFGPGAYPGEPLASFGAATATDAARTLQLGLRVQF